MLLAVCMSSVDNCRFACFLIAFCYLILSCMSCLYILGSYLVSFASFAGIFSHYETCLSSLTFRALIHFEFTFVYGVRKCSDFTLLHVAVQLSHHHLLKRLSFLHCMFLPPLSKTQ